MIKTILTPARTFCCVEVASKRKVLEVVSTLISTEMPVINANDIFSSLVFRERLGTTTLGHGAAIPHCRNKFCTKPTGLFLRLAHPVDFQAYDDKGVDLIFTLIVPEEETQDHLDILDAIICRFRSDALLVKMREANNSSALYNCIASDV